NSAKPPTNSATPSDRGNQPSGTLPQRVSMMAQELSSQYGNTTTARKGNSRIASMWRNTIIVGVPVNMVPLLQGVLFVNHGFRERRYTKPVAQDQPQEFGCPQCQARYKIVRVDAGPQPVNRPLYCKVCQRPFVSRDGEDILKYFLIDRPKTGSPRGR